MKKEDLRHLIYDDKNMISLLQDGLLKVMQGLTSFEEVLRVIDIDDDLGESDSDIKDAIIGKVSTEILEETPQIEEIDVLEHEEIENLDI